MSTLRLVKAAPVNQYIILFVFVVRMLDVRDGVHMCNNVCISCVCALTTYHLPLTTDENLNKIEVLQKALSEGLQFYSNFYLW